MTGTRNGISAILAILVATLTAPAFADSFTWDGGDGSSTDILEPTNWVGDVAPPNDATADLHFGPAAFTTVGHTVQLFLDQIVFDPGASLYVY